MDMTTYKVMRYRTGSACGRSEDRAVAAVVAPSGRIWTQMAYIDVPLRLSKVRNTDLVRYASALPEVDVFMSAEYMYRRGLELGMTKGAARLLKAAMDAEDEG